MKSFLGFKVAEALVRLIVFGYIIGSAISDTIHDKMAPDDIAEIFPIDGTEISEYEIVPIKIPRVQKRDIENGTHITIKAFGNDIDLWLNPIDGILASTETPVYTIKKGFKIAKKHNWMKKVITKLYEDKQQNATITMNEVPSGEIQLNGFIGASNIYIHPAPNNYPSYEGRSINNISGSEFSDYTYHIAYKLPEVPDHMKILKTPLINSLRLNRSLVPDTIYPEIMVIMDYPLYKLLNKSSYDAIAYILSFWNGVDLKYRSLQNPNFRLNIAGIIIATESGSLEYMQHHWHESPHDLLISKALDQSKSWFVKLEHQLKNNDFDVAMTMTSETFCIRNGNKCKRGSIGLACVGGACSPPHIKWDRTKPVYETLKSGIIHDKSGFNGINTAAHELGHLLGAEHDGKHHKDCDAKIGTLMAPTVSLTANSSDWSYCTIQDFEKFLKTRDSKCLFNKPKLEQVVQIPLPGKIIDANEQCYRIKGTKARVIDETTCRILRCVSPTNPSWTIKIPAPADGTSCGDGKICLHGQCINEFDIIY